MQIALKSVVFDPSIIKISKKYNILFAKIANLKISKRIKFFNPLCCDWISILVLIAIVFPSSVVLGNDYR